MAEVNLERIDWLDPRAVVLREAMDEEMNALYSPVMASRPPEHTEIIVKALAVDPPTIVATVLATVDGVPAGQAGLRTHGADLEVKKVVVAERFRGLGISRKLMTAIEDAARELGYHHVILQTGDLQPAAIALYESMGYTLTPPYSPYELMTNALCYEKTLA
ncbi:MAG: acetyltransferase [Microbacteriaceae bacterium]|nr:acetyltransferase [Microbacteriaceae bacterium]